MNDIVITITNQCGMLYIEPDMRQVSSQFDNKVQQLVFERPNEYAAMDLILYLSPENQVGTVYYDNMGKDDQWVLTSAITKHWRVKLQIAFVQNGTEIAHSNIIELHFRESLTDGEGELPVPPSPTQVKRFFASAEREDYILTFYNDFGEPIDSVELPESAPGGFVIDNETLKLTGNVLSVNTINDALADNTRPITSAGVHTIVGNIEVLLEQV